jgi:hypothetical protein
MAIIENKKFKKLTLFSLTPQLNMVILTFETQPAVLREERGSRIPTSGEKHQVKMMAQHCVIDQSFGIYCLHQQSDQPVAINNPENSRRMRSADAEEDQSGDCFSSRCTENSVRAFTTPPGYHSPAGWVSFFSQ